MDWRENALDSLAKLANSRPKRQDLLFENVDCGILR